MTKILVPQPIPEAAAELLQELGEVTIYPHVDRQIPRAELLEAVRDKNILYAVGEVPYDAELIEAAKEYATLGEICETLKEVFGEYREPSF